MARVLAVAPEIMFASRIEATLGAAGHEVTLAGEAPPAGALEGATDLLIVDLAEVEPEGLPATTVPILGFYRHTDTEIKARADAAGVNLVVPRSRMAREMPDLVAGLLQSTI